MLYGQVYMYMKLAYSKLCYSVYTKYLCLCHLSPEMHHLPTLGESSALSRRPWRCLCEMSSWDWSCVTSAWESPDLSSTWDTCMHRGEW